ncbi:MAG: hypothetical protein KF694_08650 [Mesorhizobium sp.]|nr:hypothetical protein [Mesorhizobium sp.]
MRILAAVLLALALSAPAHAEGGMTFYMKNDTGRAMVLELHGETQVWPGEGQVYLLEPGERKSVLIDCREGENICYGAWVHGNDRISFGVGPDGDRACRSCCSVCVAKTTTTIDMPQ